MYLIKHAVSGHFHAVFVSDFLKKKNSITFYPNHQRTTFPTYDKKPWSNMYIIA